MMSNKNSPSWIKQWESALRQVEKADHATPVGTSPWNWADVYNVRMMLKKIISDHSQKETT